MGDFNIKEEDLDSLAYIGQKVRIKVDRPMGSRHPKHGFLYPLNYGYVPGVISGDGEELDAYILDVREPLKEFEGVCVAVLQRLDDNDDKLIVVPEGRFLSEAEIEEAVLFQEKWFRHQLIWRKSDD